MGAPLSAAEIARRSVALTVAESARVAPVPAAPCVKLLVAEVADEIERAGAAEPQPRRRIPDHPLLTITISGAPSAGKSVIAHLIRNALAYEGISASGPEGLRSVLWRRGVQDLVARAIRVVLQSEETDDA